MNPEMIKHGYKLLIVAMIFILLSIFISSATPFFMYIMTPLFAVPGLFFVFKGIRSPKNKAPSKYQFAHTLLMATIACSGIVISVLLSSDKEDVTPLLALPFAFVLYLLVPATITAYIILFFVNRD